MTPNDSGKISRTGPFTSDICHGFPCHWPLVCLQPANIEKTGKYIHDHIVNMVECNLLIEYVGFQ